MIQIYLLGVLLGYIAWRTQSVIPCIIFHISINGTSLIFTSMGDMVESTLLWKGHIHPVVLVIRVGLFAHGLKQLKPGMAV